MSNKNPKHLMGLTARQMNIFKGTPDKERIRQLLEIPRHMKFGVGDTIACFQIPLKVNNVYVTTYYGKPYYYIISGILKEGVATAFTVYML